MKRKLFGTDGLRGRVNTHPMTVETCLQLGRAAVLCLTASEKRRSRRVVTIGRDTRRSGLMFEAALAAGCMSLGADVVRLGVIPTPAVAFLTSTRGADLGLVVSASHNPHWDNGVKVFGRDGFKLTDASEDELERLCQPGALTHRDLAHPSDVGVSSNANTACDAYRAHLVEAMDASRLDGLNIVLDCANGATSDIAPALFESLGAHITPIGVHPDGININDGCGATHPQRAADEVKKIGADVGVTFDGDGDRVVLVDEKGEIVDGDQILAISAVSLWAQNQLGANAVVATVMSNIGLDVALNDKGIRVIRTDVGDRRVVEEMRRQGANLGGEQSGHIVLLDHATTGDGPLAALHVLAEMVRRQRPLSELRSVMVLFPQTCVNIPVRQKPHLAELQSVTRVVQQAEEALGPKGRVLVRYSGTEPKARVMVEGENPVQVDDWAQKIANELDTAIGVER